MERRKVRPAASSVPPTPNRLRSQRARLSSGIPQRTSRSAEGRAPRKPVGAVWRPSAGAHGPVLLSPGDGAANGTGRSVPPPTRAAISAASLRRQLRRRQEENGEPLDTALQAQLAEERRLRLAERQRADDLEARLADALERLEAAEQRARAEEIEVAAVREQLSAAERTIAELREDVRTPHISEVQVGDDDDGAHGHHEITFRLPEASAFKRKLSDFKPSQPLVGFCNPLLDMSLRVDLKFLQRWGLEADSACLASEKTLGVFPEIGANSLTEFIPGGSGLNTLRVAQWILESPGSTVFIGTTGTDEFGETLHHTTQAEGVAMPRCELPDQPTGTCAVLLTGKHRSLVANLGAGAVFERRWLKECSALEAPCQNAGLFYITGFFLRTSPETVSDIAELARSRSVEFSLNLSAPFVCQGHADLFRDVLPDVDLLLGNNDEALALAQALGWPDSSVTDVACRLQEWRRAPGKETPRIVVITQGAGPVIAATEEGARTFDTPILPADEVVDTNGAGDAFVGGFLAKRMQHGSLDECVRLGQWAATIIIGRPGCTLPDLPPGLLGDASLRQTTEASESDHSQRMQRRLAARRPTLFPRVHENATGRLWIRLRGAVLGSARFKSATLSLAQLPRTGTTPMTAGQQ